MKKAIRIVLIGLAAALALGAAALAVDAAGPAGTEEDPLVTLSYLNEVFTARVTELFRKDLEEKETELQTALEERVGALEALAPGEGGGSAEYTVETLYDGQTLICQRGAELLLRVGEAEVMAADTPGLVDTTTAENLDDGQSLVKNHLYMATINGHGIRAVGTVKIVVRGAYDIS
jgi:hypothetical protein